MTPQMRNESTRETLSMSLSLAVSTFVGEVQPSGVATSYRSGVAAGVSGDMVDDAEEDASAFMPVAASVVQD